jgi:hypothetical protein
MGGRKLMVWVRKYISDNVMETLIRTGTVAWL